LRILLKLILGPLTGLNIEQELNATIRVNARNNDLMKPAKLQFLDKKRK
jgi:hypothetical protein